MLLPTQSQGKPSLKHQPCCVAFSSKPWLRPKRSSSSSVQLCYAASQPPAKVLHSIMEAAGARCLDLAQAQHSVQGSSNSRDVILRMDSIEVFALLMNACAQCAKTQLPKPLAKRLRPALAAALLGQAGAEDALAHALVQAAKRAGGGAMGVKGGVSTQVLRAWLSEVSAHPSWPALSRVLAQVQALGPRPPPQISRDGAAAEAWACARLSSAMAATAPPGWSLAPNALRADIAFERGVKGEADVLLMDEAGECQAVVEVKVGGVEPYSQLLGDVSKLQRMLAGLQGQRGVPFVLPEALTPTAPPSCSSRPQPTVADNHNAVGVDSSSSVSTSTSTSSRGGAAASGADSLASTPTMPITTSIGGKAIGNSAALSALAAGGCRGALLSFAPRLLPAYLVVADSGESMDGAAALGQASAALARVGVSRALCSPGPWVQGSVRVMEGGDELYVQVSVPSRLIRGMGRSMHDDFFTSLQECSVYQIARPHDATW